MFNPYLEEFNNIKHDIYDSRFRETLVHKYAWAVPTNEAVEAIKSLSTEIIELGAGSGYWSKVLSDSGVNVKAFDNQSWHTPFTEKWFAVEKGSIEVIKEHSDEALMLCWPPYDNPFAYEALREYMNHKGQTLIYIGEGNYGCTGDEEFHKLLNRKWQVKQKVYIPNWSMINDYLGIYTRE